MFLNTLLHVCELCLSVVSGHVASCAYTCCEMHTFLACYYQKTSKKELVFYVRVWE